MRYCIKCGARVEGNMKYCPECGAEIPAAGNDSQNGYQDNYQQYTYEGHQNAGYQSTPDGYFNMEEVQQNRIMGVLAYLGILVFVPIFAGNKQSQYVKFHSNQGLVLFIASIIANLLAGNGVWGIHSFINFGVFWFSWVFDLCSLAMFIFMIMGIVHACKGERKELPVIGQIKILK